MDEPKIGERVMIYPEPGARVQEDEGLFGRFLPKTGKEVIWSHFHHRRLRDGSISLTPFQAPASSEDK